MTECSRTLLAYLVDSSCWRELPVTLYYRAADPYEVMLTIGTERITWKLSRELLQAGTAHPVGEGDIRLWPSHQPDEQLFLHLSPPSGQALLELPRPEVLEFLGVTELLVPTGTESAVFSFDAALQALLDGDAP